MLHLTMRLVSERAPSSERFCAFPSCHSVRWQQRLWKWANAVGSRSAVAVALRSTFIHEFRSRSA